MIEEIPRETSRRLLRVPTRMRSWCHPLNQSLPREHPSAYSALYNESTDTVPLNNYNTMELRPRIRFSGEKISNFSKVKIIISSQEIYLNIVAGIAKSV